MSDIRVIRRGDKVIGTAVYVGRPSVLGNPFTHRADASATVRVASREEAISRFAAWLDELPDDSPQHAELRRIAAIEGPVTLVCWCAPLACHAHVIAERITALRATCPKGQRDDDMTSTVQTLHMSMKCVDNVVAATQALSEQLAPVVAALPSAGVKAVAAIDPTAYAFGNYTRFMQLAAAGPRQALLVGMNPGPHGMAQTGVPFGDVATARLLLGGVDSITMRPGLRGVSGEAWDCKGLEYHRGEQSGQRIWSALSQLCGSPREALERCCIVNYCPLYMVDSQLKNITPSDLPRRHEVTRALETACDEHLRRVVLALDVKVVLAFGDYADASARRALVGFPVDFETASHPSPRRGSAADWIADALPILARTLDPNRARSA